MTPSLSASPLSKGAVIWSEQFFVANALAASVTLTEKLAVSTALAVPERMPLVALSVKLVGRLPRLAMVQL